MIMTEELNLLNKYLQYAFGDMCTGYVWYHIPGGLASSGEDEKAPVKLIRRDGGKDIRFDIRNGVSVWSSDEKWAEGSVEVDIIKGVRGKWISGQYGGGKTHDVNYGIRICFYPEKDIFRKGKVALEGFEIKTSYNKNLRIDADLKTIMEILNVANIQIKWDEKSYLGNIGNYEIDFPQQTHGQS